MNSGKQLGRNLMYVSLIAIAAFGMAWTPTPKIHAQSREIVVFTTAQAAQGKSSYAKNCASCHGENLEGGSAPTLKGAGFSKKWFGRPADILFNYISERCLPAIRAALRNGSMLRSSLTFSRSTDSCPGIRNFRRMRRNWLR